MDKYTYLRLKRTVAALLTGTMVLTAMPFMASAKENQPEYDQAPVTDVLVQEEALELDGAAVTMAEAKAASDYDSEYGGVNWTLKESFEQDGEGKWAQSPAFNWKVPATKSTISTEKATADIPAIDGEGYAVVGKPPTYVEDSSVPECGKIMSAYVYDADPNQADTYFSVGMGGELMGLHKGAGAGKYIARIDGATWKVSQHARIEGWHRFVSDYTYGNNVVISVYYANGDSEVLYDSRNDAKYKDKIKNPSKVFAGNLWGAGAASAKVCLDDIKIGDIQMIAEGDLEVACDNGKAAAGIVSGTADSAQSAYQWQVSDTVDGDFTDIEGAVGADYVVAEQYVGKFLRVRVEAVNADGREGNSAVSAAIEATGEKEPEVPTVENLNLTYEVQEDGTTNFTATASYVPPAGTTTEGHLTYAWAICQTADGTFEEVDEDTNTYTLPAEKSKWYVRVTVTPATDGVPPVTGQAVTSTAVVKEPISLVALFNSATAETIEQILKEHAPALGIETKVNALPAIDLKRIGLGMLQTYTSEEQIVEAFTQAYEESAKGDPALYQTLESDGFEGAAWAQETGKTAMTVRESELAREGKKVAVVPGTSTNVAIHKFAPENVGRHKYIMYMYDSGEAGAVSLIELTCSSNALILVFRPDQAKGFYATRAAAGQPFVSTGIPRSKGWHRVEWDFTSDSNLKILLDGAVAYDSTKTSFKDKFKGNVTQIKVGNLWGSGVGGSTAAETLFDAMSVIKYDVMPTMKDVSITQDKNILTVNGTFEDLSGAGPGAHQYKWFSADMENGEYTEIEGETRATLTLGYDQVNKYFKAEVIPVNDAGRVGEAVTSGVWQENYLASMAPVASAVTLVGEMKENGTATADYQYIPSQGSGSLEDKANTHYVWYVSDTETGVYTLMPGVDQAAYRFTVEDSKLYFKVGVRVQALDGRSSPITFSPAVRNTSDVLWVVKNASRTQLISVFPRYLSELNLESEFAGYSETTILNIYKSIAGKAYTSISALKKAISDSVSSNAVKPGGGGTGSGGSRGGGGGRTGGGLPTVSMSVDLPGTQENNTPVEKFGDLVDAEWAKTAINYMADRGFLNGKEEHVFAPNDNITRVEFLAILMRCFRIDVSNAASNFEDVSESDWFYSYVAMAAKLGLVNGKTASTFNPEDSITREEMATMLYRFAQFANRILDLEKAGVSFIDGDAISGFAEEAIRVLSANGIVNGIGDGFFDPQGLSTRAMAAQMVYNLIAE